MIPSDSTKALIASLVRLATTDGHVATEEAGHIQLLAFKNGIDPGEFDRICSQPEYYLSRLPVSHNEKLDFLAHLIAFVSFDLRIAAEEKDFCIAKARKLGLDTASVEAVFAQIDANGGALSLERIREGLR
jgi:hypothetical protein